MDLRKLHKKVFNKITKVGSEIDSLWYQTGNYYSNTYELIDPKYQKKNDDLCVYLNKLHILEDKILVKLNILVLTISLWLSFITILRKIKILKLIKENIQQV